MAVVTQTVSQNVNFDGVNFAFNQFDSNLGTLNSITLKVVNSIDSGLFYVFNYNNFSINIKKPNDSLTIIDNQGSGADYNGDDIYFVTTPDTANLGYTLAGNTSQNFTITPKSLIGDTEVIRDLSSFADQYTGTGNVSFDLLIGFSVTISGGVYTIDTTTLTNQTTLQLIYTYTPNAVIVKPVARLLKSGAYLTSTHFDEVTYAQNKISQTAIHTKQLDEVTIKGSNVAKRETRDGKLLVSNYFDEVTPIN